MRSNELLMKKHKEEDTEEDDEIFGRNFLRYKSKFLGFLKIQRIKKKKKQNGLLCTHFGICGFGKFRVLLKAINLHEGPVSTATSTLDVELLMAYVLDLFCLHVNLIVESLSNARMEGRFVKERLCGNIRGFVVVIAFSPGTGHPQQKLVNNFSSLEAGTSSFGQNEAASKKGKATQKAPDLDHTNGTHCFARKTHERGCKVTKSGLARVVEPLGKIKDENSSNRGMFEVHPPFD